MKANKKITGEFTQGYPEAVRPMAEWLMDNDFAFKVDGLKFTVANMSDTTFDKVYSKGKEFDNSASPQMDLFEQSEPKDVTPELELLETSDDTIDGDFEEVE
ncbi:hypothetical protein [Lactovum miscens]|uniref:Uncharacterized protein n=1 Tax=Lactovum miscens TaxID=190387 RepID=A0A841C629_9LACT|nr:hypothetical protein [Lactovum miscens]MBB5887727.1 hypothetical protein [Lactovum miscens]